MKKSMNTHRDDDSNNVSISYGVISYLVGYNKSC